MENLKIEMVANLSHFLSSFLNLTIMEGMEKILYQLTEGLMRHRDKIEALTLALKETNPDTYKSYEKHLEEAATFDPEKYKNLEWYVSSTLKAIKDKEDKKPG